MGKIAQLEDDFLAHFEGLVSNDIASEVGLLFGQFGGNSRDLVFGVAPCPPRTNARSAIVTISHFNPDSSKGKKGPLKPTVSARLDVEWIAEHGVQVERMLPGGLQIVGLYVFVPETGYQSCVGEACSVLTELRNAGIFKSGSETLVLHVDEGAKKHVMRSCSAGATSAADLKPVEIKFGPGLKNLVCLRTVYHVDICLPASPKCDSLQQHMDDVVAAEYDQIRSCQVFHEGQFVDGAAVLTDLLPQGATAAEPWDVQLYRPLSAACGPASSLSGSTTVVGRGRIQGTLEGRVYCNKRLTFEKAAADLKEDLCHSLRARADLIIEDAERWTEQKAEDFEDNKSEAPKHSLLNKSQLGTKTHYSLPFRVFVPWKSGVTVCDYLMPGETTENTHVRMKDMLALEEMDGDEVTTAERLDEAPATRSSRVSAAEASWLAKKWNPHSFDKPVPRGRFGQQVNLQLIVMILVTLIALLVPMLQFIK